MPAQTDRSREEVINVHLARLLRVRLGLNTAAETLRGGAWPDIIVRRADGPVVIETELEPARTVDADALSRLGLEIDGHPVQIALAVTVPGQLRQADQSQLDQRLTTANLAWREWRLDGTSGPNLSGDLAELGAAAARAEPPAGNLEAAVEALDQGVRRAGSRLYESPGTLARVAKVFNAPPGDEVANMAALVVTNAMVFQERLASSNAAIQPTSAARSGDVFSRLRLLTLWDAILEIDYYPIFHMARNVVAELSEVEAAWVLDECAHTAARLLSMGAVGRHDLAGRIFNELVADRKLLAAFYTSIPAATLLAGLALTPERWPHVDWDDAAHLRRLCVVDPACGTGTLLMAAYQQIMQNRAVVHGLASATRTKAPVNSDDSDVHQALVEHTLFGADVVPSGHSPDGSHTGRHVAVRRLYPDAAAQPDHGGCGRSRRHPAGLAGLAGGAQSPVLVLSHPGTDWRHRQRGQPGRKSAGRRGDQQSALHSALLKGTPANQIAGHAASFTVLADRLVKPDGRLALVLPVTALAGESWRQVRAMLAERYAIELVVSSHDPELRSMSYDTHIAEALLLARRLREDEPPSGRGGFVNLWRAPRRETDALALANAINVAAAFPLHRSDGPPIGGSPLFVGGEQCGELLDGPVDDVPWTAARWKQGQTGQFAAALERGELWAADGSRVVAQIPVAPLGDVCQVGPQDRQIRGSIGAFDAYHGWDEQAQYPALWAQSQKVHQGLVAEPNARLFPQVGRDHRPIWSQAGTLQVTRDVRYNSQRVMTIRTNTRTLGIRAWFALKSRDDDPSVCALQEMALVLWHNSTLGLLLHANHANRAQHGRGTGNKGMLETLPTLDVRRLQSWQLDEAQAIFRDFQDRIFESFHRCTVDPMRIDLDRRIIKDLLALPADAAATLPTLRTVLASEPSIHGAKQPELPS